MKLTGPAAVVLDTSPLNLLTRRLDYSKGSACWDWYAELEAVGCRFYVPEIADFEARREYLRAGKADSLTRLDEFNAVVTDRYLPLTTPDIRLAAQLWAQARNANKGGAPPEALDGDTLIAAQARRLPLFPGANLVIVATENVSHLARLTPAAVWSDIRT